MDAGDVPSGRGGLFAYVRCDIPVNRREVRSQVGLVLYRLGNAFYRSEARWSRYAYLVYMPLYRLFSEIVFGWEIRPKTPIGPRLTIHHGFGLVLNDHTVIGSDVVLRHGVTLGNRRGGGGCPTLGDRVEIGAGAVVLGPVTIGDDALIAANAFVTTDVPAGHLAVGNPAEVRPRRDVTP